MFIPLSNVILVQSTVKIYYRSEIAIAMNAIKSNGFRYVCPQKRRFLHLTGGNAVKWLLKWHADMILIVSMYAHEF